MVKIRVLVENSASLPFAAEHGLALAVEYNGASLLFDTGAGEALVHNCRILGVDLSAFDLAVISHGHGDHTGALYQLPPLPAACAPGADVRRYSLHPGKAPRDISMPEKSAEFLRRTAVRKISGFTEVMEGIYLTGPIPRVSGEDCGGPFFFDTNGGAADHICDEQALLLDCGVLIQGCCHAGIINTFEFCRRHRPEVQIHTVVGGLHLLTASAERLEQTAAYLKNSSVRQMYLMHCTGADAAAFLQDRLTGCVISSPAAGDMLEIPC